MTTEDLNPCTFCNGKGTTEIVRDVGFDICWNGEEHQHLERCSCGAERMVVDFFTFDHAKTTTFYGSWTNTFHGSWTKYQDGDETSGTDDTTEKEGRGNQRLGTFAAKSRFGQGGDA